MVLIKQNGSVRGTNEKHLNKKRGKEYRHAQCSQSFLSHGHSHTLLLSSRLPAGCFYLQVDITVLPQRLQKVLRQRANSFITGYLLQLVQVGY